MRNLIPNLRVTALALGLCACGPETEAPSSPTTSPAQETTETHSTETAEDPSEMREVNIPRTLGPYEIGESYLRYAAEADPRIRQTVRCETDSATQTGSALRFGDTPGALSSLEWVDDPELPSGGTEGITQLRYRGVVVTDGETHAVEGVLTMGYDHNNRTYYVVCPIDSL